MEAEKNNSVASQVATVVNIPGYEIKDVLGRGGMATVYLAVQQSIGRQVALKVLSPDHADPTFSDRFLSEARIISKLSHPNIVTIYDAGIHQGCHYMAMEYIRGKNMRDARDDLTRKQKIGIIKQIAQALSFAGSKGYVHRDIKPENIMLNDDGRAILTDFGIARASEAQKGLTQTGKTLGTPYYMSPEQTKGTKVDHRSDIYSLGVVLFQVLADYVPYDGASMVEIGIKHISEPIPPLPPGLEIFQPIINICMSKDPDHRYQTADDFLKALNNISDAELDFIEAKAKASAGKRPAQSKAGTGTMIDNAVSAPSVSQPQAIPQVKRPARNRPPVDVTATDEFRQLRRRRRLFVLFLLVLVAVAGYYKRDYLIPVWHEKIAPVIEPYLPDSLKQQLAVNNNPQQANTPEAEPGTQNNTSESSSKQQEPVESTVAVESAQAAPASPEQLLAELDNNPENAAKLAAIYRQQLTDDPENVEARAGIQQLQEWFRQQIKSALDSRDTDLARLRLASLVEIFPRAASLPRFSKVNERIDTIEKYNKHLKMANVYFATNALTQPAGANALEELQAAESYLPDSEEPRQGYERISEVYYEKAKQAKEPQEAMEHIEAGLLAIKDHAGLLELQKNYAGKIASKKQVASMVGMLNDRIKKRQYIKPAGNSLYDLSKKILQKDPGNAEAIRGLQIVEEQFVLDARHALKSDDPIAARKILDVANQYFPDSLILKRIARKVDAKIDATYPRITRLLFSDKPITSLNQQISLDKMKGGQKLYIGFSFKNFYSSSTTLDIRLTDPTGQDIYTEIPVQVNGLQGEHYFSITLPNTPSPSGNYALEILMENTPIQRAKLQSLH